MDSGIDLIARERERQVSAEGWTPAHDDTHTHDELAWAAVCYAAPQSVRAQFDVPAPCGCREAGCLCFMKTKRSWVDPWPWDAKWDKRGSHDRIKALTIAGALIAAEIDRLQRKAKEATRG